MPSGSREYGRSSAGSKHYDSYRPGDRDKDDRKTYDHRRERTGARFDSYRPDVWLLRSSDSSFVVAFNFTRTELLQANSYRPDRDYDDRRRRPSGESSCPTSLSVCIYICLSICPLCI